MAKKLCEMSLEELWELFPIYLTKHNCDWKQWYKEEQIFLQSVLPMERIARVSHIGSTAVDTIWAKPIIDILAEIKGGDFHEIPPRLTENGYICMMQSGTRISFNKGYTENGFADRVFHLHLRYAGDNDELYFRDYLNLYPEIAKEYEALKLDLWKQYEHHRDAYTEGKTDFIAKHTAKAKKLFLRKYKETVKD